MTKFEEILIRYNLNSPGIPNSIEKPMKQYAEWYAKKCLKVAAEKALAYRKSVLANHYHQIDIVVDQDSILNIQLPNHE